MKTFLFILITYFVMLVAQSAQAAKFSGYSGYMQNGVVATIANGQTTSSLVKLVGFNLVGIQTPAALTGTTLTFQACNSDGSTCVPLKVTSSGTALSQTVTTSSYYAMDPVNFHGVAYLKLVSGSSEGGARSITLSLKGF